LARRPQQAAFAPGRRLGRFHLIERLGQGCQGQVWKALQVEPIVETLALKLLSSSFARDPNRLAQFHREAEMGARLESPSLLPTYEFGSIDGLVFMTMPLVNGRTLSEAISQRGWCDIGGAPLEWNWWTLLDEAAYIRAMARVLARIARAVQVAHENRVAHRDIKAANILLDRDREDRVFLCDFGLSCELSSKSAPRARDSTGTPLYMAPEKLVGSVPDEVRCDVYSLGVTLFEAVTRVHPFSVPDDLPRSDWAAYLAVSTPPIPSSVNPKVSGALEAIIVKTMDRNPSRRYASALELAIDLERFASVPASS
jgi:serine/threonine-protein kinase